LKGFHTDESYYRGAFGDIRNRSPEMMVRLIGLTDETTWKNEHYWALFDAGGYAEGFPVGGSSYVVVGEVPERARETMLGHGFVIESTDETLRLPFDPDAKDAMNVEELIAWLQADHQEAHLPEDLMRLVVTALDLTRPRGKKMRRVRMRSKPEKHWCYGCRQYVWITVDQPVWTSLHDDPSGERVDYGQVMMQVCGWCGHPVDKVWERQPESGRLSLAERRHLAEGLSLKSWTSPDGVVHIVNPPAGVDFGVLKEMVSRRVGELAHSGIDIRASDNDQEKRKLARGEVVSFVTEVRDQVAARTEARRRGKAVEPDDLLDGLGRHWAALERSRRLKVRLEWGRRDEQA
jgi:hypothetical protein